MSSAFKKIIMMANQEPSVDTSKYLTMVALEDGFTAQLSVNACQYSFNCVNWVDLPAATATPAINAGDKVYFKATGLIPISGTGIGTFSTSKMFNLEGNCNSMLFGDEADVNLSLMGYNYAFYNLFSNCTTLQSVSRTFLPATRLAYGCYIYTFNQCTGLITAPELPATSLDYSCYNSMFNLCTGLTVAPPKLPATTLYSECYRSMFNSCSSLTTAPELPATTLVGYCYFYMFYGCTKLNYIKMLATDISATNCLNNWVNGVSSTGTFVKNVAMTSLPNGASGIPTGWTVENYTPPVDTSKYLTMVALEDGFTAQLSLNACQYSFNCVDWVDLPADTATPAINAGDKVYFKATGLTPASNDGIGTFSTSKTFNLEGNCNSMLFGDEADVNLSLARYSNAYRNLFLSSKVVNVSEGFLPATTLTIYCYYAMFNGCTALTTAPELPATTLAEGCYIVMFNGCTALTTAPELPATTLAHSCYNAMFRGCTALTTAPELPATTLIYECYRSLFQNCTNLNYIKMLATDISATNCLYNWVNGVSSTGTFVKNVAMTSLPNGASGIPEGWTVENYTP